MRKSIIYFCEFCDHKSNNKKDVAEHERYCLAEQQFDQKLRDERIALGQLTIGKIIDKSKQLPNLPILIHSDNKYHKHIPYTFCSYRGYYDELAVTLSSIIIDKSLLLKKFISKLQKSLLHKYPGYKSGLFSMTKDTLLWVSPYGHASGLMVTDLRLNEDHKTISLCVKHNPD